MLAAADTFRAAASEQLSIWADRVGINIVKHAEGADPSAVIYDAIQSAKAKNIDVLICDTAGRLQNKKNLMDELNKMNKVIGRGISWRLRGKICWCSTRRQERTPCLRSRNSEMLQISQE